MRSEFDLIQNIKKKYDLTHVGDDCAVLPKDEQTDLLVTADMLVEDIDFRLRWTTPEFIGHKALAVSLSDVAAMGGTPVWATLSIAIPESLWNTDFLDRFYNGWFALASESGVELVGGDVSRSPDKLVIDSMVGGQVARGRAILRSTAKAGDAIFVSGTLGGAAAGLKLLEDGDSNSTVLIEKQLKPRPQLAIANLLQQLGMVTSMIDISDGLSSDLQHICDSSGTGALIYFERLPIRPELQNLFSADVCLQLALSGGEDFELLFTADEKDALLLHSLDVTYIGHVTTNVGVVELNTGGQTTILHPKGYHHF